VKTTKRRKNPAFLLRFIKKSNHTSKTGNRRFLPNIKKTEEMKWWEKGRIAILGS